MMDTDAPDRLVTVPVILSRVSDDALGVETNEGTAVAALDLGAVVLVMPETDDDYRVLPGRCEVTLQTGHTLILGASASEVIAAWAAYRTHADKITRLRN